MIFFSSSGVERTTYTAPILAEYSAVRVILDSDAGEALSSLGDRI